MKRRPGSETAAVKRRKQWEQGKSVHKMEFVSEQDLSEELQDADLEEDSRFEDWSEEEGEEEQFTSLFSKATFPSIQALLEHEKTVNNFDLIQIARDTCKDEIDFIKLVNFVRKSVNEEKMGPEDVKSHVYAQNYIANDVYMIPVLADDALLFHLEDIVLFSEDADENEDNVPKAPLVSEEERIAQLLETQGKREEGEDI
ncbi:hypothetical protein EON65_54285 [archaeon]|nr:MAG: hypothetical protein EON65_54285 [archaeon]